MIFNILQNVFFMQAVTSTWCFYIMKPLLRLHCRGNHDQTSMEVRRPVVLVRPAWAARAAPPAPSCGWLCLTASVINRRDGCLSPTSISPSSSTMRKFSCHHAQEEGHHGNHHGHHNGLHGDRALEVLVGPPAQPDEDPPRPACSSSAR